MAGQDQTNYDVVMYGLQTADEANRRFSYGAVPAGQPYVLSQLTGNYCNGPSFLDTQHTIETKADAEAYLARLEGLAKSLDQEIGVSRHDAAKGVAAPDFALAKTVSQMTDLRAPAPGKSPMTESLVRRTKEKNIPGDWAAQSAKLIADKVYPALDRQIALVKELQKKAVHDAGVWRLPDGEAYYRDSLKSWATTDMSPQEIHKLGLSIVKDHTAQIDAIMKAQGLTKGTVGERLHAMHTDPKFIAPNTDAAKEKIIAGLNEKVESGARHAARHVRHSAQGRCEDHARAQEYRSGTAGRLLQQPLAGWETPRHLLDQSAQHRRSPGLDPAHPHLS